VDARTGALLCIMAKKKKKQSKSLESLLSLIGWIIILLGLAILFITTYLIDSDSFFNKFFNKYTISIFLFILGLGFFLIWPKELKDYENDEIPISLYAKFLVLPPFFGTLLIFTSLWILFKL